MRYVLAAAVALAAGLSFMSPLAGAQAASPDQVFRLTKLAQRLPVGVPYIVQQAGVFCIPAGKSVGDGVLTPVPMKDLGPIFRQTCHLSRGRSSCTAHPTR